MFKTLIALAALVALNAPALAASLTADTAIVVAKRGADDGAGHEHRGRGKPEDTQVA